jgi:hypothetical protein
VYHSIALGQTLSLALGLVVEEELPYQRLNLELALQPLGMDPVRKVQ